MPARPDCGFTLIELVIVIIVIGIGAVTLAATFSKSADTLSVNETLQQATQFAQECAERVLATRRNYGFDSTELHNLTCSNATVSGNLSGQTYNSTTVLVSVPCNGHTVTNCPCPTGGATLCRDITVTGSSGTMTATIAFVLADYPL